MAFAYEPRSVTQEIYCPRCFEEVESIGGRGPGPVWPAFFFLGNKEIATVIQRSVYVFELKIYDGNKTFLMTKATSDFPDIMAICCPVVQKYVAKHFTPCG